MKKLHSVLLAGALGVFSVVPALAQTNLPAQCSGFAVQNTSSSAAAMLGLMFYREGENDNLANLNSSDSIPPSSSKAFYVPSNMSSLPSGGYGAVISSDQPVKAVVTQATCGSGNYVMGSYSSFDSTTASADVILPQVLSRAYGAQNWSSFIAIQNTGAAATSVTMNFYNTSGGVIQTFTKSALQPNESWFLDLAVGTYATAPLNGFAGAARVTSLSEKLGVVVHHVPGAGNRLSTSVGIPSSSVASKLYVNQLMKNFVSLGATFNTGFLLYNPSNLPVSYTIDYIRSSDGVTAASQNGTLVANGSLIAYTGNFGTFLPDGFYGSATITVTSGPGVVGTFNVANTLGNNATATMGAAPFGGSVLYVPQYMKAVGGVEAGIQVQNLGTDSATVRLDYYAAGSSTLVFTQNLSIPVGAAKGVYSGSTAGLPSGFSGNVVITKTAGTGLVAANVNIAATPGDGRDALGMYNALP